MADAADGKNMLPKMEIPAGVEGQLNLDQIKALVTGRRFHGKITFRGNITEENYEFFPDGSAKMWGQKALFGGYVFEGKGTWVVRDWQGTPSLCWSITGTWANRSCNALKIENGSAVFAFGVSIK
jgi:hypothetical protein